MTAGFRMRVGIATAAAIAVAVLAVSAVQAGSDTPAQVVALLRSPPTAKDALPTTLAAEDFGRDGLAPDSSRYVGGDGPRRFWVATDSAGAICIIVALGDRDDLIASACNFAERIAEGGQLLGVKGRDGVGYTVYLLPDAAVIDRAGPAWTVVGDNVLISETDKAAAPESLPVEGGPAIELRRG